MSWKCDICGSEKNIVAGDFIFYCPKHKKIDWDRKYENLIKPELESENPDWSLLMDNADDIFENLV